MKLKVTVRWMDGLSIEYGCDVATNERNEVLHLFKRKPGFEALSPLRRDVLADDHVASIPLRNVRVWQAVEEPSGNEEEAGEEK